MTFTKKIIACFIVATSALWVSACGAPANVEENGQGKITWTKLDNGLYRGCDTTTGTIIYEFWESVSTVKDGCQKAGAQ